MINLLNWFLDAFHLTAQDKVLIVTSFSFDLTQKNLFAPLLVGGTVYLFPLYYDISAIRQLIRKWAISILNCTPSMVYPLANGTLESVSEDLASLRRVFLGGEPIAVSRLQAWMDTPQFHAQFINTYGPTECADIAAFYRIEDARQFVDAPVPIGQPIANVQLYVLDHHFNLAPVGVPGELYIGGAGLGTGYLHQPALTAEKFVPHPFSDEPGARLYKTGDLVRDRPDGALEFLGRLDYQVKIRGFRIELGEIENVLQQQPIVRECVVIAREDLDGDKRLIAYLVLQDNQNVTDEQLRLLVGERLPHYMVPATFVILENLALTPNGKIDRLALPDPQAWLLPKIRPYVAPRTPNEEVLQRIWAEVLQVEQVGIDDNFFELGGHSLLATTLISRVREAFQVALPLRTLFDTRTIASMAEVIEKNYIAQENAGTDWDILSEIENLSDEEIDHLLQQEEVSDRKEEDHE